MDKNALGQTPDEETAFLVGQLHDVSKVIIALRKATTPILEFYQSFPEEPSPLKRTASLVGLVYTELLSSTEALYGIVLILALRDPLLAEKISGWISPADFKHHHASKPGTEGLQDTAQEIADEQQRRNFGIENN